MIRFCFKWQLHTYIYNLLVVFIFNSVIPWEQNNVRPNNENQNHEAIRDSMRIQSHAQNQSGIR